MLDLKEKHKRYFIQKLMQWHEKQDRKMPWKETQDPYKIWLSEIILQQTRVAQGTAYYLAFIEKFPTVKDLAEADEDEVLKTWQGLGYYSRARNLHFSAKLIMQQFDGKFPSTYPDILSLKGVGTYTAAAIASFAYNLPHAVVDGNVIRVLARYFDMDFSAQDAKGKKAFQNVSDQLIQKQNPAAFNQAIMDFGALQCKPRKPDCKNCPLQKNCLANEFDKVESLPRKKRKIEKKDRFFHFFILEKDQQMYIQKRTDKDIWQGLYCFPFLESKNGHKPRKNKIQELLNEFDLDLNRLSAKSKLYHQILSHQEIHAHFYHLKLNQGKENLGNILVDRDNLINFAFPKLIDCYLRDNSVYLV